MPSLRLDVKTKTNIPLVRKGLQNLTDAIPKIGRQQLYFTALRIYQRTGIYPAGVAGAVYERTYTLRDARILSKTKDGYTIEINPVDRRGTAYGVYVLGYPGGGGQALYHQNVTGWTPVSVIMSEELEKLPEDVLQYLAEVATEEAAKANAGYNV